MVRETIDAEEDKARRRDRSTTPRLIRAIQLERLEAGGGPTLDLAGLAGISLGRGEKERFDRAGAAMEIALDDPSLSTKHARFVARGGGDYAVEDLGSRNGTRVDGRLIEGAQVLRDGSVIETGRTLWVFRASAPAGSGAIAFGPTRSFSPLVAAALQKIEALAPTTLPLLLHGETGTGKEVAARQVHDRSARAGRFVAVNCGALAESVLESELFGHKKGAFTGAAADRVGMVEAANGGTLFLDEIAEMPLTAQVRLLRVLQEGEVVPVGATTPRKIDLRFVAATHRDLETRVGEGSFRADLLARLSGYVIRLPKLRDRIEDLGELIAHFVRRVPGRRARATLETGRALFAHAWPYNVRELEKAIEAALALAVDSRRGDERAIDLEDLPERLRTARAEPDDDDDKGEGQKVDPELHAKVVEALKSAGGNVTKAAELLGKHRQQLQRWMRKLGIKPDDYQT